jgi:hypothetical protein
VNGALHLGGTSLTVAGGEFGVPKITASGSAPGASGGKIALVCGTNAGTVKLIAYAGTSTTGHHCRQRGKRGDRVLMTANNTALDKRRHELAILAEEQKIRDYQLEEFRQSLKQDLH